MKYLMIKVAELVGGLTEIKNVHFYLNAPDRSHIPGYARYLLVVDFADNTRKLYRYNITREQFEFMGKSSRFLPVEISDWIVKRKYSL